MFVIELSRVEKQTVLVKQPRHGIGQILGIFQSEKDHQHTQRAGIAHKQQLIVEKLHHRRRQPKRQP